MINPISHHVILPSALNRDLAPNRRLPVSEPLQLASGRPIETAYNGCWPSLIIWVSLLLTNALTNVLIGPCSIFASCATLTFHEAHG